jgi:hypothetical protein
VFEHLNASRRSLARFPQLRLEQKEFFLVRSLPVQNLGFVLDVLANGFVARGGDGV